MKKLRVIDSREIWPLPFKPSLIAGDPHAVIFAYLALRCERSEHTPAAAIAVREGLQSTVDKYLQRILDGEDARRVFKPARKRGLIPNPERDRAMACEVARLTQVERIKPTAAKALVAAYFSVSKNTLDRAVRDGGKISAEVLNWYMAELEARGLLKSTP